MFVKEKLNKSLWSHFEITKDTVITNVNSAIQEGRIKLDQVSANQLLGILTTSIDQGFYKGISVFNRELDSAFEKVVSDSELAKKN